MAETNPQKESPSVFKWVCLLVAVVALSVFGWMLNDVRLQVRAVAERTENLETRAGKILTQVEHTGKQLDDHLPVILADAESAADALADVSHDIDETRGGMTKDADLFRYGSGVLDLLAGQDATIGVKPAAPEQGPGLQKAMPAKTWAKINRKDARYLSLYASSKTEVLRGLTRANTLAPLYIQFRQEAPLLLSDWLRKVHPESKDLPW